MHSGISRADSETGRNKKEKKMLEIILLFGCISIGLMLGFAGCLWYLGAKLVDLRSDAHIIKAQAGEIYHNTAIIIETLSTPRKRGKACVSQSTQD
jgi:hypothetical protein